MAAASTCCPLAERRRSLLGIDWVRDATVSRLWPDRLAVRIVERKPVAFIQFPRHERRASQRVALIDAEGVILEQPPRARFTLPVSDRHPPGAEPALRRQRVAAALRLVQETWRSRRPALRDRRQRPREREGGPAGRGSGPAAHAREPELPVTPPEPPDPLPGNPAAIAERHHVRPSPGRSNHSGGGGGPRWLRSSTWPDWTPAVSGRAASSGALENSRLRLLGAGVAKSEGWWKGRIADQQALVASMERAIRGAEKSAGVSVASAVVGMGGASIEGLNNRGLYEMGPAPRDRRGRDAICRGARVPCAHARGSHDSPDVAAGFRGGRPGGVLESAGGAWLAAGVVRAPGDDFDAGAPVPGGRGAPGPSGRRRDGLRAFRGGLCDCGSRGEGRGRGHCGHRRATRPTW